MGSVLERTGEGKREKGKEERENEQGIGGADLFTLLGVGGEYWAVVAGHCGTVRTLPLPITTVLLHEYTACNNVGM